MPKRNDVSASYDEIARNTTPELDMFAPTVPPPVTNRELATRVSEVLRADPRLIQTRIQVRANGSRIWLSGAAIGAGTVAYATFRNQLGHAGCHWHRDHEGRAERQHRSRDQAMVGANR